MKIRVLFMTLALILVVLISGCKKNESQVTVGVCPIVISTIPANGAVSVPLNQIISATFNEAMNASTLTSSSFTIVDASKSAELKAAVTVTGTITYSGMTAFFTPSSPLLPHTTYTGRVTTAVKDLKGNALQTDYVWTFATDLPPTVASDPINNATGVLLNKVVVATFSVPMDSLTLKSPVTNFTIKQGTTTVPGKFSYSAKAASFTPTANLAPFTVYTGTISGGVKNMLGTSMGADYVWSFTTIPQLTLLSSPLLGGTTTGSGLFVQGSNVTVVATANPGFTFFNWTEGATVVSSTASYQFAMAGNKTLVANFTPKFVVTVLSNPILGGISSGGGSFNSGTSVTVTAVPNSGFTFTNWTDGVNVVSSTANYQFTLTANRSLVANYAAIPYTVSVISNPILGGTTTGSGTFNSGASVSVSATPNVGFTFTNWTEGVTIVSSTAQYQFILAGNRTLVANYTAIPYTVVVNSNPALGGITTGGGIFNAGASVTVTATSNAGFTFTNWTEGLNIVSTNASYQFTIDGNRTLVANYNAIPYSVAVSSKPVLGGTTTGGGIFNSGSLVTVNAVPNVGYTFVNWTEGLVLVSSVANYQFTITSNRILVANYSPITFMVAVSSNPLIGGSSSGGGTFNSGASVTVSAAANAGYTFTNWTEGLLIASTNSNYGFTLTGNRTLVANYAKDFTLVITAVNGSVVKNPNQLTYTPGTSVQLTAVPNSGYTFSSWSGDATGIINPLTILMNSNKAITANFTVIPPSGPLAIDLGCAAPFAILAGSTITSTGPTIITGNVGLSAGTALIGFPPGIINGVQEITTPIAAAAKLCLTAAYIDGQSRSLNSISMPGNLGGLTLAPGLYTNSSTSGITGTGANGILTLDAQGNANAVWIFQMGSTFTTDPATSVVLAGGAQAKNIFWIVGTSATLGTTSVFYGNILADQSITLNTGAVLNGRALTRISAVTLDASAVTKPL